MIIRIRSLERDIAIAAIATASFAPVTERVGAERVPGADLDLDANAIHRMPEATVTHRIVPAAHIVMVGGGTIRLRGSEAVAFRELWEKQEMTLLEAAAPALEEASAR